jgi:hypothetical protein
LASYSPSATCPELWHYSSIPLDPRAVLPSPVDKGGFHLYAGFACHGNAGKLINEHSTKVMRAANNHLSAPASSLRLANSFKSKRCADRTLLLTSVMGEFGDL